MSAIPIEVINKLSSLQNQIWQTVSKTVSEAAETSISFTDALTVSSPTADLYSEMSSPRLVVQFAFANLPENSQVLILGQETVIELLNIVKDEPVTSIDDNVIADLRPIFEGLVQGICLAIGNIRNEAVLASGMTVRYQIFSFPPNLQRTDTVVRTNVAVSGENVGGSAIWLMDSETAHNILGMSLNEEDTPAQDFLKVAADGSAPGGPNLSQVDDGGLDLLMDIPLEISVELGRVKMVVKDVVELGSGSIVEIDKAAGEPVDVMVNGRLVARGEVVVIEDNFGVRITEILSPRDRLAKLNEVA